MPPLSEHWTLEPGVKYLNHGSFGACPRIVLEAQSEYRARMERQPVRFLWRELPDLIDAARTELADFIGANDRNLAFVTNATAGVNAVVRSLTFQPGDELLTTDHCYNACRNVLNDASTRWGAKVVVAKIPFPIANDQQIIDTVLAAVTPRTKLALIDHITSPTAIVFPVKKIVRLLREEGIDTLVDGAHAPGAVPVEIEAMEPAYYTGNLHKWVCAPKGAGFLWARPDRQAGLRPPVMSHGENTHRPGRSIFHDRFDWPGTLDPTAWLAVPHAIRWGATVYPGGWEELRDRNRSLASAGRALIAGRLGVSLPAPCEMLACMATLPLPESLQKLPESTSRFDPVYVRLLEEHEVEVPIIRWGHPFRRWVLISAQAYNTTADYRALAEALVKLAELKPGKWR
jgi:isopenicillin-N epimerase